MVWNGPCSAASCAREGIWLPSPEEKGPFHEEDYHDRVGLGEVGFQIHGVGPDGSVEVRRVIEEVDLCCRAERLGWLVASMPRSALFTVRTCFKRELLGRKAAMRD